MPATEPLSLLLNIPSFIALDMQTFGPGQITALVLALLCLFISGFVSGSEMAFFSLTEQQCDELDKDAGYDKKISTGKKVIGVNDTWQEIADKISRRS